LTWQTHIDDDKADK